MKLIFLTSFYPYGNREVWAANEIDGLTKNGAEVLVFSLRDKLNITDSIFLLKSMLFILKNPKKFKQIVGGLLSSSNNLNEFLKSIAIIPSTMVFYLKHRSENIYHIHAYSTTTVASRALILSLLYSKDFSFTIHTSSELNSYFEKRYDYLLDQCSFVRTISEKIKDDLNYYFNNKFHSKIKKIHLGIKCEKFENPGQKSKSKNEFTIVMPAVYESYKGHSFAFKIIKDLVEEFKIKLICYGEGSQKEKLLEGIKRDKLTSVIEINSFIPNQALRSKYQEKCFDLLMLTSNPENGQEEGIPVSIMEAMVHETLAISTKSGAVNELLPNEFIVNHGDYENLKKLIISIYNMPCDERLKIIENNKMKILSEFNHISTTKQILACIN